MSSTTAQATSGPQGSPADGKPERRYGVSSLFTACRVMWRGSAPAFLAITVNAIIQALLTWWNPQSGLNVSFVIAFLVSLVSMVAFLAVVTRVSLDSIDGKVTVGSAIAGARRTLPQFALWLVAQWALITVGMMINALVGVLVAILTPFLPLAASDGARNALGANFSAIKDRWGRWLVTAIILAIGFLIWFLLTAVNTFFVKGMLASLLACWVGGVLAWWIITAWAAIYRSTRVGDTGADPDDRKDS